MSGMSNSEYTFADAVAAVVRAITDPGFLLTLAVIVAVIALLVAFTPKLEVTGRMKEIELCRLETHHKPNRKPDAPLRRGIIPRLPGWVYSEQVCRCAYKSRVRLIAHGSSAKAQRWRNEGKL